MKVDVEIELLDVDVVLGAVLVDNSRIGFAANLAYVGRRLELTKLHLHGAGQTRSVRGFSAKRFRP